jgi:hypothetical protein
VPDVLVRDLDPATHGALKRRAEAAGVSMQAYITRLLDEHASRPTVTEWLELLDGIDPAPHVSGAEVVAAARGELP